jgi:hypothetical protein
LGCRYPKPFDPRVTSMTLRYLLFDQTKNWNSLIVLNVSKSRIERYNPPHVESQVGFSRNDEVLKVCHLQSI